MHRLIFIASLALTASPAMAADALHPTVELHQARAARPACPPTRCSMRWLTGVTFSCSALP